MFSCIPPYFLTATRVLTLLYAVSPEKVGQRSEPNTAATAIFSSNNAKNSAIRIQELLADGNVAEAAANLGQWYTVNGVVLHGKKLGRTLGFPTANMELPPEVTLLPGVYAVWFRCEEGRTYAGVACFGVRPTVVDDGPLLLETTLLDFSGCLYGQNCSVFLVDFIRRETKFDDLSSLVAQMNVDVDHARNILRMARPLDE
ncbi:riboflavin kinase [Rhizobium lusitanum]|uniref:riboflavin kinase n=1 Tax=Rhizobium lusitanum TaxID=293958 RepID=UPI00191F94BA|nr:riboflavin kinase [Rhizobium lusitanum]